MLQPVIPPPRECFSNLEGRQPQNNIARSSRDAKAGGSVDGLRVVATVLQEEPCRSRAARLGPLPVLARPHIPDPSPSGSPGRPVLSLNADLTA